MDNKKIPDESLDKVAGGEGVSAWEEAVSVTMIIGAKLSGMSLEEFLAKHPKYTENQDLVDYIARVWNAS